MNLLGLYNINKLPLSLVNDLAEVLQESFNRNLNEVIGLSYDCWQVLNLLVEEPTSTNSLQGQLNFTRTQINHCIDLIQNKGWIDSEESGRQVSHALNDEGQKGMVEISKFARVWERRCFVGIDANEIHQFYSVINQLRQEVPEIDITAEALKNS